MERTWERKSDKRAFHGKFFCHSSFLNVLINLTTIVSKQIRMQPQNTTRHQRNPNRTHAQSRQLHFFILLHVSLQTTDHHFSNNNRVNGNSHRKDQKMACLIRKQNTISTTNKGTILWTSIPTDFQSTKFI